MDDAENSCRGSSTLGIMTEVFMTEENWSAPAPLLSSVVPIYSGKESQDPRKFYPS